MGIRCRIRGFMVGLDFPLSQQILFIPISNVMMSLYMYT